ncbi:hypothetical protein [Roseibium album]|uniref:hypothetical protein n=1 Tax=Roseibium album TaxID=311410 RepID=UPI003BAFB30B
MSAPVTSQIDWRSVAISITHHKRRWDSNFDHIEVQVIGSGEIPITETGYRSLFVQTFYVEEFDGPQSYVLAWLEHEVETPQWKKRQEAERPLSLF